MHNLPFRLSSCALALALLAAAPSVAGPAAPSPADAPIHEQTLDLAALQAIAGDYSKTMKSLAKALPEAGLIQEDFRFAMRLHAAFLDLGAAIAKDEAAGYMDDADFARSYTLEALGKLGLEALGYLGEHDSGIAQLLGPHYGKALKGAGELAAGLGQIAGGRLDAKTAEHLAQGAVETLRWRILKAFEHHKRIELKLPKLESRIIRRKAFLESLRGRIAEKTGGALASLRGQVTAVSKDLARQKGILEVRQAAVRDATRRLGAYLLFLDVVPSAVAAVAAHRAAGRLTVEVTEKYVDAIAQLFVTVPIARAAQALPIVAIFAPAIRDGVLGGMRATRHATAGAFKHAASTGNAIGSRRSRTPHLRCRPDRCPARVPRRRIDGRRPRHHHRYHGRHHYRHRRHLLR